MYKKTQIEIHGLSANGIAYCEAEGLSKVFSAYANECPGEYIKGAGFNPNSGYVYIALENGISICSMLGRCVEYIVTNLENGEESFFYEYSEATLFYNNNI
jgi:hypothetical protein